MKKNKKKSFWQRNKTKIILALILLVAFLLRTFHVNWDLGYNFHPDERAIIMSILPLSMPSSFEVFLSAESPLNPGFFAYGNMPFYLFKGAAYLYSFFDPEILTYKNIAVVGRIIISFFEIGTIALLFLLGRKIFNERVGLGAALVYSFSVFPIQLSHFFTVDPIMSFFFLLTIYALVLFYERKRYKHAAFIGVCFGLALASKISAAPLIFPILITLLLIFMNFKSLSFYRKGLGVAVFAVVIFVCAFVTWSATQPYVIIDFGNFFHQTLQQSLMSKSAFTFPYTLQYVDKIPYFYELRNVFLWGLGPFIGILSLVGVFLFLKNIGRGKKNEKIILLSGFVYFLIVGQFAVGWMRYMMPLYPFFAIFAGVTVFKMLKSLKDKPEYLRFLAILFLCAGIFVWAFSFLSIYTKQHTRLAATEWMLDNIPSGSTIATEHWDDRLPIYGGEKYTFETLPLYNPETSAKWEEINGVLDESDYIIIASERLFVPLQKLTNCESLPTGRCYKDTAKYYGDLFAGKLGYELIKKFEVYPTVPVLGVEINDQSADESFTVYDHPRILIFERQK